MGQIALGFMIGAGIVGLGWLVASLSSQIHKLNDKVKLLEGMQRKRMPWDAQAEVLDALAVLDRLNFDWKTFGDFMENAKGHLRNSLEIGDKPRHDTRGKADR